LGGRAAIGPFDIEFIALTHSIPEPNALAIRTKHGTLFHTGDWKFDPEPLVGEVTDYAKLQALGDEDVLALIGDSTNVFTEGKSGSERDVRDTLVKLFSRQTGRIVVGCFASNIARLESIAHAAGANGRHVALVGASLWRIVHTARKTGYLSPSLKFYEAEEAAHLARHEVAYICTGSQGEGRAALMRIAFGQHPDVTLEAGDVAIFSSRVIPGNEQAVHKVQNQLIRLGVELVTWRDEHIHVSGHPAKEELRRMYGLIRPRIAVPVHAKLALECQVPQAVRLENGQALKFADGRAEVMGAVWAGRWAWLDGEAVPLNDPTMRERKRLLYDGAVVVSLAMDEDGQLTDDPQISLLGIGDPLAKERDRGWEWVLANAVERLPKKARRDDAVVEEAVRGAVRKVFVPMGRKPLVKVHIAAV
jgi:ribonuclease J